MSTNIVIPCAGFIVLSKDMTKVVIVSTHANNLGFPKGKRNRFESYMQTALRELEEETGLTSNEINIVENVFFDEMSLRGHPATRYFVALIKDEHTEFFFDEEELEEVCWLSCDELLESDNFRDTRKIILKDALSVLI